ncbi:MAG: CHAT domain-containing protein [bacterium]
MINKIFLLLVIVFLFASITNSQPSDNTELPKLLYSTSEVERIAEMLDGDIIFENKLIKQQLLKRLEDYDILHFATHAEVNDLVPLSSNLKINSENDSTGSIYLYEIYGLNLKAQMAVLSACNTGIGKMIKSEGMISLARAFKYANCSSVITSLWEVGDKSTSEIMTGFYSSLIKNQPKDIALREAKLKYINESNSKTASPYYWAGIIPMGDSSPLHFKDNSGKILYVFIVFGFLFGYISLRYYLRKRKVII